MFAQTFVTPVDSDPYMQLFKLLGYDPVFEEAIDVSATVCTDRVTTSRSFSQKVAGSAGVAAGRLQQFTVKAARGAKRFIKKPETKVAALIAHWTTWSMLMVALMSMSTTLLQFLIILAAYFYVTNILFEAMLAIN